MRPVPLGGLVTQKGAIMPNGVVVTSFGGGLLIITLFFYVKISNMKSVNFLLVSQHHL
jgi:hypothetical protein